MEPMPEKFELTVKEKYEYSVARLEREVDTSRARISRFFFTSGLLLTAMALVGELEPSDPLRWVLLVCCPIAGIMMAHAASKGLVASQSARNEIKAFWKETKHEKDFPPFYAQKEHSDTGRDAVNLVPRVITYLWVAILACVAATFIFQGGADQFKPTPIDASQEILAIDADN